MMHDSRRRREPVHDVWIGIDPAPRFDMTAIAIAFVDVKREDAAQETLAAEARRTVLLGFAGLTVGVVLTALVDWLTAGPGLRVMVGL